MLNEGRCVSAMEERHMGSTVVGSHEDVQELTTTHNANDIRVSCAFGEVRDQDSPRGQALEPRPHRQLGIILIHKPMFRLKLRLNGRDCRLRFIEGDRLLLSPLTLGKLLYRRSA